MRDSISRISVAKQAAEIRLSGSTKPEVVLGEDGKWWVHKPATSIGKRGVFAELLASLVGQEFGAPIPSVAVVAQGRRGFLSQHREGAFHWNSAFRGSVVNMEAFGAALAMDAVIGNIDRHYKNIVLEPTGEVHGDDSKVRVWCIDHENSWLKEPSVLAALLENGTAFKAPACQKQPRDLPMGELGPLALAAASRAQISDAKVAMFAHEAGQAADVKDEVVSVVADVLSMRCRQASHIVEDYISALEEHCS